MTEKLGSLDRKIDSPMENVRWWLGAPPRQQGSGLVPGREGWVRWIEGIPLHRAGFPANARDQHTGREALVAPGCSQDVVLGSVGCAAGSDRQAR